MSLPLIPIWLSDVAGAGLVIVFALLSLRLAMRLREQDRDNMVWTYMLWLCYALAAFAVSRSVGHIAKRLLVDMGYEEIWEAVKPLSGAINTLMLVIVGAVTLFFERTFKIYQRILASRQAVQEAHEKLLFLNRNLENLVEERTKELALSERRYRRIFEVSRDMIVVVSGKGAVVDINPAGRLGLPGSGDFSGEDFGGFFVNDEDWRAIRSAMESQGYVSDTEVQLKHRDTTPFAALLSGAAERRGDGSIGSVHFLIKDISQWKAMERQLLQADKLASIGQLAAGIAHEINNPLGMILGYTQLLLRNEPDAASQRHADLKTIEKHTRTCKMIVGDLLSFARSTRTKKDSAHIHSAIEEILSVVRHQFELDGVRIETGFDPGLPTMTMDVEKTKQVFMNLVMNARQAIGKRRDGSIRLETRFDAGRGCSLIRVEDTGCGIDSANLPRIFDPFFTTKGTGEGTGLGLSVSYGIVKDHGGDILVESKPGEGTAFTVVLPVDSRGESNNG
ncbi:MAG: two-component system sensor histidine kinase NtrB [Acidobacteriota bacterium]